ncbi:MAG: DUF1957 domain-containing protein [Spirochaetaceae bacterium]|jgi:1,4-alpha-glucan branching enzyme|nr:DUF1957 domain-containing protein [Spirochaetaceae bacterium]
MTDKNVISIVLNAHIPFVRKDKINFSFEEIQFFAAVSETLLPLLEMFDRLEADRIPFRMAMAVSPVLCHLLADKSLISHYIDYVDSQIAFGETELERVKDDAAMRKLAEYYYDTAIERRVNFTERYDKNIPKVLSYYQKKGRLELLASPATNCFLPFYLEHYEVIRAQIETALISHKKFFGVKPDGFWLPDMGYHPKLSAYLRNYGIDYTIIDTLGAILAEPRSKYGSFFPLKTKQGLHLLIKDFYAYRDIMDREQGFPVESLFRNFFHDAADDLPLENIRSFIEDDGTRLSTGYKYYTIGDSERPRAVYNPEQAAEKARNYAEQFIKGRASALSSAEALMREDLCEGTPVSLCAWDADFLGRFWHEGIVFLESVFRVGCRNDKIKFMTPSEYIDSQNETLFQTSEPEFSSSGFNGYAESWLDESTGQFYRHLFHASMRMAELAERFKNETGIKERALKQAAREMLLALSSDWPRLISTQNVKSLPKWRDYAMRELESHLKNFTTIYEALGSSYLSTRFLTETERLNRIFPDISYTVFRRK